MASAKGATVPGDRLQNDDIGLDRRLELFRLQVEIRDCKKRAARPGAHLEPTASIAPPATPSPQPAQEGNVVTLNPCAAPIINAPQVGIHSADAIRLSTNDGDFVAPRMIGMIGQSFDHRAFDGAYSAAFLSRLKEILETRNWDEESAMDT